MMDMSITAEARAAFVEYYLRSQWLRHAVYQDLNWEVEKRIDQTILLMKRILEMLGKWSSIIGKGEFWDRESFVEIEAYIEAFYWIAWRTRCVLRKLPELQKFEAEGVLTVRNHIVEHPKKDRIYGDLNIGEPQGPFLKYVQPALKEWDEHPDLGLFINATEFYTNLRIACEEANDRLKKKGAVIKRMVGEAVIVS